MMLWRARRWLIRGAVALMAAWLLVVAFVACTTPFIPLPPPADPTFTPIVIGDSMGAPRPAWEARGAPGAVAAEARVFVYNIDAGSGIIARAQSDGSYAAGPMDGQKGDRVQIFYQTVSGQRSSDICRVLTEGVSRLDCIRVDGGRD